MRVTKFRVGTTAAALALVLALSACGSDNAVSGEGGGTTKSDVTGSIAGAGASSQKSAVDSWIAGFSAQHPGATLSYDPVGSGAGVSQFLSGAVAFAGTDEPLNKEEIEKSKAVCAGQPAFNVPIYVSPVAIIFNLDGIKNLKLDPVTIAKIFRGEITKWNDPAIVATNAGVNLPDAKIVPVHRADKSGTTENFTDYLHAAAPQAWTDKPSKEWPIDGGEAGDKTAGVIQVVKAAKGTISYADASQAGDLGTVELKAGDGFVKYSPEAAAKTAETSPLEEGRAAGDLAIKLDRTPKDAGSYPLVLISYYAVCSKYDKPQTAALVKDFVKYAASKEGQAKAVGAAGSAPLSDSLREKINAAIEKIG